ncbi:MAG: hypothetical protein ABSE49_07350 [Polyangiaceae bacterium]
MAAPARNPYAPPGALAAPPREPGPLPAGASRHRLDAERYRAVVRARMGRLALLGGVMLLVLGYWIYGALPAVSFAVWAGFLVLSLAVLVFRIRRLNRRAFDTYELLVGPRVIRRTIAGVTPAEVLRPEVTGAFETRHGVWLTCEPPRGALFISRAVEGYDALCTTLQERWRPFESVRGWRAWRLASAASVRQRGSDEASGGTLASDAALAQEVEELRRASSDAWLAFPQVSPQGRRRAARAVLALWVVLILLFLVVWQLLSPGGR